MIDYSSYTLTNKNYYEIIYPKKQIVIGNTFNSGMYHYIGWKNRSFGSYKKGSNFTIDVDGKIYQHFDPKYYSDFLTNSLHNKEIISIVLVNLGWLEYDLKEKKYFNCIGIPSNSDSFTEKRWRSHTFWDKYTPDQIESLCKLTKYLLKEHNITKNILSHNTFVREISGFEGVTYRSNWIKDSTDLSPSFDFDIFKSKIEEDEI